MKNILLLFLPIFFFSCSKKNDSAPASLETVILGYELRDEVGKVIGNVGIPNIKLGDTYNYLTLANSFFVSAFPNPSTDRIWVYIGLNKSASNKKLWMVKANYNSDSNQSILGANQFVSSGLPVFELDSINSNYPTFPQPPAIVSIDCKDIPSGYYRLYFQADNIFLWDNIVVSK